jgi:hypothetical protein
MALVLADRVRDTTTTTGTGTVTLSGTAPTGYQNFSVIGNGNTCYYTINAGSQWEVGIGTYSSTGPTLARTTILASSSSGSAVDFAAGTKDVFVTYPAEKSVNYDASDNVGIGNTAPSYKLEVTGDIRTGSGGDLRLGSATGTTTSAGDSSIFNDANDMYFNTGNVTRMYIANGGNIGIGNTGPGYRLDISSADTTAGLGYAMRIRGNSTAAGGAIQFTDSGATAQWGYLAATSTSVTLDCASAGSTIFRTNGSERMRIDSSGNVGIGTSSPGSFKLNVQGNSYSTTLAIGADENLLYQPTSNTLGFRIGTSANQSFFNVKGVSGVPLLDGAGGVLALGTGGSTKVWVNGDNVGIGTSSPTYKLEVFGSPAWMRNFAGTPSSPTETQDWPVAAFNVASYGDFSLQTMMAFTLPNDGNYFLGYAAWNFKLDQTASSTTSAGVNGMQFGGPGYLAFMPGTSEKARITSAGYLLVGTTAPLGGNTSSEFKVTGAGSWPLTLNANDRGLLVRNSAAGSGFYAYFEYNGGTNNGSISWSGGTTAYNTTSDARVKKNIVDAPDAGALIDAIKVRSWDFKVDDMHWRYGMVAQELLPIAPEAVTVPEDEEKMMGIDYSKLVPMLIKEVQSLRARVAELEGK